MGRWERPQGGHHHSKELGRFRPLSLARNSAQDNEISGNSDPVAHQKFTFCSCPMLAAL
jgi:hypothetical protein